MYRRWLRHEQDPSKQRPLTCSFPGCDFRHGLQVQMKSHLRNHLKSKGMFKCKLCANERMSSYPDKGSLHHHECMAHNKTPYKCSVCAFTAFHLETLHRHYHRHHNCDGRVKISRGAFNWRIGCHFGDFQCKH